MRNLFKRFGLFQKTANGGHGQDELLVRRGGYGLPPGEHVGGGNGARGLLSLAALDPRGGGANKGGPGEEANGTAAGDTFWIANKFNQFNGKLRKLLKKLDSHAAYWAFNEDDIVQFEFGRQLEAIEKHAGCQRLSLITYSNGAYISFAYMAAHDEWARTHLDTVVAIAPAVYLNRLNLVLGAAGLVGKLSPRSWPVLESHVDAVARLGFARLCKLKTLRYSLCKLLLNQLFGPSNLFETQIELSLLDYIGRPVSSHCLRQLLQASYSGHLRRYDYGPVGNLIAYEQIIPPAYPLQRIRHERIIFVTGTKDAIADERSVSKLIQELGVKSIKRIQVDGYNHLDLLAGHDNLRRVNEPILQVLDDRHLETDYYREDPGRGKAAQDKAGYVFHGDGAFTMEQQQQSQQEQLDSERLRFDGIHTDELDRPQVFKELEYDGELDIRETSRRGSGSGPGSSEARGFKGGAHMLGYRAGLIGRARFSGLNRPAYRSSAEVIREQAPPRPFYRQSQGQQARYQQARIVHVSDRGVAKSY